MACATVSSFDCDRDLTCVPRLTFGFVDEYVKSRSQASGERHVSKGIKYFSESYIHSIKVKKTDDGCRVSAKCYRSQRKNETPHNVLVLLQSSPEIAVQEASCSCAVGKGQSCGHVCGLLYQLAKYKACGTDAIPVDIAKTSQPQTWHCPRGPKISGKAVQDIEVKGNSNSCQAPQAKHLKSTLYNPVRGVFPDFKELGSTLAEVAPNTLILPSLKAENLETVETKFGMFSKGSVIGYQQKLSSDFKMNVFDGVEFPKLPVKNVMENQYSTVLSHTKLVNFCSTKVTPEESQYFDELTLLQSDSSLWYTIRENRITASNVGSVTNRCRAPFETLVPQLKTTRKTQTQAMKDGLEREPLAAEHYSKLKDHSVNLYPSGVIVSPYAPWIAGSPDRKVYNPSLQDKYGLLEIKCPQTSLFGLPYLKRVSCDTFELKKNHKHYYQVLTQMAVTGLPWCDFFVWVSNDEYHLEKIQFDAVKWQETKNKIDMFYFDYFL